MHKNKETVSPDSCLAISPNGQKRNWEDVECNRAKTFYICAYTNGNLHVQSVGAEILNTFGVAKSDKVCMYVFY